MESSLLERRIQKTLHSRASRAILRRVEQPSAETALVDFSSNDYLSLATNLDLRERFISALAATENILGSKGSRLLDGNSTAHFTLEMRLKRLFNAPAALLFNSGYEANVSIFSTVPHVGDAIILDELVHASVWDGCRASRAHANTHTFKHNSPAALRLCLLNLISGDPTFQRGDKNIFVAVESLYSMDGDFSPLLDVLSIIEDLLPQGNGHLIVDEAHTTGLYGSQGRGVVALLGLENRILVRLHTFGKALATNGAVVFASPSIRSYLCNYARPLIYSTALSHANLVAINCSLDMLENGDAERLSAKLGELSEIFANRISAELGNGSIGGVTLLKPAEVATSLHKSLRSPIYALLTPNPRALAQHLQASGFMARPITYPTVPQGQDRVRICLHAGNTEQEVDQLVRSILAWGLAQSTNTNSRHGEALSAKL